MKRLAACALIAGCSGPIDPDPQVGVDAPPSPPGVARCIADGPGELPPARPIGPDYVYEQHTLRMNRATGAVVSLDGAHVAPLGGRATARIEDGRLVVRRGGQIILSTDARGAVDLAWDVERDGVLYLGLFYGNGEQTYQALRLDAAPNLSTVWCSAPPNAGLNGIRGGFATAHGPLIIRTDTTLSAISAETGSVLWQAAWPNAGGPFTLLETDAQSVVCDRDVAVFDQVSGALAWRHALPQGVATECAIVGDHVVFAARRCGAQQCVVSETGALALADGSVEWSVPNVRWWPLAALDRDRAVVSLTGGVAVLDASTGSVGPTLAIPQPLPWGGELLAGGDVLLQGIETLRISTAPLAVQWRRPYASVIRDGQSLLATKAEGSSSTSTAWLIEIDLATGAERVREVERRPIWSEVAIANVVGFTDTELDMFTHFGPLD